MLEVNLAYETRLLRLFLDVNTSFAPCKLITQDTFLCVNTELAVLLPGETLPNTLFYKFQVAHMQVYTLFTLVLGSTTHTL